MKVKLQNGVILEPAMDEIALSLIKYGAKEVKEKVVKTPTPKVDKEEK